MRTIQYIVCNVIRENVVKTIAKSAYLFQFNWNKEKNTWDRPAFY